MLSIKFLTFVLIIIPLIFSKVIEDPDILEIENYNGARTEEISKYYSISIDDEIENKYSSSYSISHEYSKPIKDFLQKFFQMDDKKIKSTENAKAVLIKYLEYYDARLKFDNFEISSFDSKLKNLIDEYQSSNDHKFSLTTSYEDKLNDIISYYNLKNNVDSKKSIFSLIHSSDDNNIDNGNDYSKFYVKKIIQSIYYHDSKCGKQSDNAIYKCNNNLCCSSNSECGNTEEYCGTGCNPEYGICW